MAHSERYGADHPLAKASSLIKRKMRIPVGPLLNFGDAVAESAGEEEMLDRLWQEPGPLAASARAVADAIESDGELRELTAALPDLPERLRELAEMADWAAGEGARLRLTFVI
jgi:hypothetical protein